MVDTDRGLQPFVEVINGAQQIAPVAIVWPIRSFLGETLGWQGEAH